MLEIISRRYPLRLAQRRIGLEVTRAASALLAHEGYDPAFGARPLKRVIQRELGDRVAVAILEGKASEGDTIVVDAVGDELVISTAQTVPALPSHVTPPRSLFEMISFTPFA